MDEGAVIEIDKEELEEKLKPMLKQQDLKKFIL